MLRKEFKSDALQVKVFDTRQSLGEAAGAEAAAWLRKRLEGQETVRAIFAAAPSQNEFLAALAAAPDIDWHRVHALHMDEYVGLPADAPQAFGNFLRAAIFDKVPFGRIDYIGTEGDPEAVMARYDRILAENPVDVVFMGIGENGHIAFNDPHVADFNDPLRIKKVDLDLTCRTQQVHDGCFATLGEVPEYALTLTIPALVAADRIFCVVPAATKADAVRATVLGPVTEKVPATVLRHHPAATLYVDSDSGKYIM